MLSSYRKVFSVEDALAMVKEAPEVLELLPEELLTSKFYAMAVQEDSWALLFVPEEYKTPELCLTAVQNYGPALAWVPDALKTPEICLVAVKDDGWAYYDDVPAGLQTPELYHIALQHKEFFLAELSERSKTPEVCLAAVTEKGRALKYVPNALKTREICLAAVRNDGFALRLVPETRKTPALCRIAIQKSGMALEFVPEQRKTPELCWIAVQKNGAALEFVPDVLKTRELCLAAVQNWGGALYSVPGALKTRELCIAAVRNTGMALVYVPKKIRTRDFYLRFVRDDVWARQTMPELEPEFCLMDFTAPVVPTIMKRSRCRYDIAAHHLYCTLPQSGATIRMRSWAENCRLEMETGSGWSAYRGALDLPLLTAVLTAGWSSHPVACYARHLPEEVVRGIAPFPYGRLNMLRVCAASERGEQLLQSAPLLLWLTAPTLLCKSRAEPQVLHDLLGLRQRDLLALHCGRGNNALLRLLAKLPVPDSVNPFQHRALTDIVAREDASSLLRHKTKVDWKLIAFIRHYVEKNKEPLFRSIVMSDMNSCAIAWKYKELDKKIRDTVQLGQGLGIADAEKLVATCTDWKKLSGLHDTWTERLNNAELDILVREYGASFPPPPLPGTEAILPVDSVRELLLEGKRMHHCVGSYIEYVRSGECYIYRVMEPERATLEIYRGKSGAWVAGELKGYCNTCPGVAVTELVQEWLAAQNRRSAFDIAV